MLILGLTLVVVAGLEFHHYWNTIYSNPGLAIDCQPVSRCEAAAGGGGGGGVTAVAQPSLSTCVLIWSVLYNTPQHSTPLTDSAPLDSSPTRRQTDLGRVRSYKIFLRYLQSEVKVSQVTTWQPDSPGQPAGTGAGLLSCLLPSCPSTYPGSQWSQCSGSTTTAFSLVLPVKLQGQDTRHHLSQWTTIREGSNWNITQSDYW